MMENNFQEGLAEQELDLAEVQSLPLIDLIEEMFLQTNISKACWNLAHLFRSCFPATDIQKKQEQQSNLQLFIFNLNLRKLGFISDWVIGMSEFDQFLIGFADLIQIQFLLQPGTD